MSTVQLCIIAAGGTPITGYGVDGALPNNETGTAYTGYCYPAVYVAGGAGGYFYSWSFTNNPGGYALSSATASSCTVSHAIGKFGFDGTAVLQCVISDSAGQTLTISNVSAIFSVA